MAGCLGENQKRAKIVVIFRARWVEGWGLAVTMQNHAKWLRSRFLGKARREEGAYRDEDL